MSLPMEPQSVVVIQDASGEINLRVFEWALRGLSLMPGDMLTLIVVMHQVITPMGYKSSVDSRLIFGANQKIIEEQVARKKEEIMNNEELAQIFRLYKSKKVGFKTEMATGSSPKAVALKSAMKLKPTWLVLDRKMKNDEEYFLQKLSCGILRIRRFNKIDRIRGPLLLSQETRPGSTCETYPESIPPPDTSTEPDHDHFSIEISPAGHEKDCQMTMGQKSLHDEAEYSTPDPISTEKKDIRSKQLVCQTNREQQWQDAEQIESTHHGKERDQKLKQKYTEENRDMTCGGRCSCIGGAKSFYLGGAAEYKVCEQFFTLSNFHLKD